MPWLFAVATAGWFGWMARRAGRSWALWAVGGGAFGLVVSTLMIGLGLAMSIPYSEHQVASDAFKWIVVALLLVSGVGWLLTAGLHRHRTRSPQGIVTPPPGGPEPKPAPVQK